MAWLPENLAINELASEGLISLNRLSKTIALRTMGYQLTLLGNKLRDEVAAFFGKKPAIQFWRRTTNELFLTIRMQNNLSAANYA